MARKTKKQVRRRSSKMADERHVGTEVTDWKSVDDYDRAIYQTLRHYAYYYDKKEYVAWSRLWVKENRSAEDYAAFCKAEDWRVTPTLSGLCRMIWNGLEIDDHRLAFMNKHVDIIVQAGNRRVIDTVPVVRKTPAELTKAKTSEFLANLEGIIDTIPDMTADERKDWNVYDELKRGICSAAQAKAVIDYYTPIRDEYFELVEKKTPDLLEAYSTVSLSERRRMLKFYDKLLDDCQLFISGKKATRKPRAKKEKPVSKIVSGMKLKTEDAMFKIVSVSAASVVGAQIVYMFNTKYRAMTILTAATKDGLSVKGTTIIGFDPTKSYSKKIRKPEEFFAKSAKTTKTRLAKMLDEVPTKASEARGRTNEHVVLYKVY